ncbi:hypothetical protein DPMN_127381 [Dreissena polymorpha]|uniref:Uncharacterized protein n=1 Tax=Dreissena polymorpha TaxID=45954 RepID=A0A9D4GXP9_DREPO|nr:hypothetical protein DPMN_127381 [Dreissena polymorpha]
MVDDNACQNPPPSERRRLHGQRFYIPSERSARENNVDEIVDDNACQNPPPNDVRSFIHNVDIHIVHKPQEASNCQFNSISHQVQNIGIYRTGMQLRHMAVDHIKNKDHYGSFTEGPIIRYLQRMANKKHFR